MTTTQEERLQQAICDELRAHRARKRFTQQQLADGAGLSVRTVNRIDQGEHAPNMNQLYRLCRVLGVDMETLLAAAQRTVGEQ